VGTVLDIDSADAGAAMRAFVAWAGAEQDVRLLYTPDVLLAVDAPHRRGYLIDEVYFVTVWVDRGLPQLRTCLACELGEHRWTEEPSDDRPDPAAFLAGALAHGRPLPHRDPA